jgi:hypothetical protein
MTGNEVEGHSQYTPVYAPRGTDGQMVPELTFTPGKF